MNVLYLILPLSFVLVSVIVFFAVWAVKNQQFEDLSSPGQSILNDDDEETSIKLD